MQSTMIPSRMQRGTVVQKNKQKHTSDRYIEVKHLNRSTSEIIWNSLNVFHQWCLCKLLHIHITNEEVLSGKGPDPQNYKTTSYRSSSRHLLDIPQTRTKFGERSFTVAGPAAWNALPVSVREATSVNLFKHTLKTHLFRLSYPSSSDTSF